MIDMTMDVTCILACASTAQLGHLELLLGSVGGAGEGWHLDFGLAVLLANVRGDTGTGSGLALEISGPKSGADGGGDCHQRQRTVSLTDEEDGDDGNQVEDHGDETETVLLVGFKSVLTQCNRRGAFQWQHDASPCRSP